MQSNKLRMAIRSTAAVAILGVAAQANAVDLNVGDNVKASLYGYARLNMTYDINDDRQISTGSGTFSPSANPEVEGHFDADVQQTRLGVRVKHDSGAMVNVEGDFRGSGHSAGSLRMRHAYGEYKGVLAGRTWSNFTSFVAWTPTLDFDGLAGNAGMIDRVGQVRYTTGPISVAIEDPGFQGIIDGDTRTSAPALTARLENSSGALSYSVAAVASQVTADDGTNDDSAVGFGTFGAVALKLNDMFTIRGAVNFTDGANGYLWRSGDNFYGNSAYVDGNGNIETIEGYGGTVSASMALAGGRSINIGYGTTTLDLDDAVANSSLTDAAAETNQNVMVNYQWTPVTNVMMGVEYAYFEQETAGGTTSDANRVMFAAQYSF